MGFNHFLIRNNINFTPFLWTLTVYCFGGVKGQKNAQPRRRLYNKKIFTPFQPISKKRRVLIQIRLPTPLVLLLVPSVTVGDIHTTAHIGGITSIGAKNRKVLYGGCYWHPPIFIVCEIVRYADRVAMETLRGL